MYTLESKLTEKFSLGMKTFGFGRVQIIYLLHNITHLLHSLRQSDKRIFRTKRSRFIGFVSAEKYRTCLTQRMSSVLFACVRWDKTMR
jgi:hypothetical protein